MALVRTHSHCRQTATPAAFQHEFFARFFRVRDTPAVAVVLARAPVDDVASEGGGMRWNRVPEQNSKNGGKNKAWHEIDMHAPNDDVCT